MPLSFYFLDVGQGDGTLVEFDNGETMLIDLGSLKNKKIAGPDAVLTIANVWDRIHQKKPGVDRKRAIEHLVVTHGDEDHTNLLPYMCSVGFTFDEVYYGGEEKDYSRALKEILDEGFEFEDSDHSCCGKPWRTIGGTKVHVLAANVPTKDYGDPNTKSVVLRFEHAGKVAILCGDAEVETEEFILENFKKCHKKGSFLKADVLKLGHHGSGLTNHEAWLKEVRPRLVVASGDQRQTHPHKDALDRVKAVGSLGRIYSHEWYCYDGEKGDWVHEKGKVAILTTVCIEPGVGGWSAYGVCYSVTLNDDGSIGVSDTLNRGGFLQ